MKNAFFTLVEQAFCKEIIKKLVFSRPKSSDTKKISARLCTHRNKRILAMEFFLRGDTVSHKNVPENELEGALTPLFDEYRQINLITTLGDAEYKRSSDGKKEVVLGEGALRRRMSGESKSFERAIESLDLEKNYILTGKEDFLFKLGISDKNGRVHDKKQGKFRQINRFLENVEDVYSSLPGDGPLTVYDLCCGKSYLSFAVYYYLTSKKEREVLLLGLDLKRDVIDYCNGVARDCGFVGMRFICDDISHTPSDKKPDMVISLHACDTATDLVIDRAISLSATVILSTPCCHRYLNGKIKRDSLKFVTDYPHLQNKLCEAITDAIRIARLKKNGYSVACIELTDPENTPKNTLIRAVKNERMTSAAKKRYSEEYERILDFVLGDEKEHYLK